MYTDAFDYYRADSVDEAVSLLDEHDGSELLAGAQGILTRMKTGDESPPALVDIGQPDGLSAIEANDGTLSVGAMATHAELAESESVADHAAALSEAAGEVGDPQIRNGGTIGGNLAHGDPRSDPPAAVLALDAGLVVQGPDGERTIDATDLFDGSFETAVGDQEVATRLRVPVDGDAGSAYHKRRDPSRGTRWWASLRASDWTTVPSRRRAWAPRASPTARSGSRASKRRSRASPWTTNCSRTPGPRRRRQSTRTTCARTRSRPARSARTCWRCTRSKCWPTPWSERGNGAAPAPASNSIPFLPDEHQSVPVSWTSASVPGGERWREPQF